MEVTHILEAWKALPRTPAKYLKGRKLGRERGTFVQILRNDPCVYCGCACGDQRTIDHITPAAEFRQKQKGTNIPRDVNNVENLTSACLACNQEKKALPLLHFLIRRHHVSNV
jgi:hypothetical protein